MKSREPQHLTAGMKDALDGAVAVSAAVRRWEDAKAALAVAKRREDTHDIFVSGSAKKADRLARRRVSAEDAVERARDRIASAAIRAFRTRRKAS